MTKELIVNIFKNNDMKNKNSTEIIEYLENLESKELLDSKSKLEIIYKFLEEVYDSIYKDQNINYIPNNHSMKQFTVNINMVRLQAKWC
mgnify:CR=1 FL=1